VAFEETMLVSGLRAMGDAVDVDEVDEDDDDDDDDEEPLFEL